MKIKRSIFATISGEKNGSGEAQFEGAAHDAASPKQGTNDSRDNVPIGQPEGAITADPFYQRLILRTATIDELFSDDVAPLNEPYGDTDLASRRLAAWRAASTGSDQPLFERRLARDGRSIADVMARFGPIGRNAPPPPWLADAQWVEAALQSRTFSPQAAGGTNGVPPCAFEHLLLPVLDAAEMLLRSGIDKRVFGHFGETALTDLRRLLLHHLLGFV